MKREAGSALIIVLIFAALAIGSSTVYTVRFDVPDSDGSDSNGNGINGSDSNGPDGNGSSSNGSDGNGSDSNGIIESDAIHGIAVTWSDVPSLTQTDYNRFNSWNLDCVMFVINWGNFEYEGGGYNEANLAALESQVRAASSNGFKTMISPRVRFQGKDWEGWAGQKSYDYVNTNLAGRERYGGFMVMLARRYPDSMIVVDQFPYHAESLTSSERENWHKVAVPYYYDRLRAATDEVIIVNPVHQGQYGGQVNGFYLYQAEDMGWPFTDDSKVVYGISNHGGWGNEICSNGRKWDGNEARIDELYAPVIEFSLTHGVTMGCVESLSFRTRGTSPVGINCGVRPIDSTRMAWADYHMDVMGQNGVWWVYWQFDAGQNPVEPDGSDTEIAMLIQQYA